MSFLPYESSGPLSWIAAGGTSALVHAALVFVAVGGLSQMLDLSPPAPPRLDFVVTLEQLSADTLAGMIEQQGVAGAEDPTGNETMPQTPAAVAPEAVTPEVADPITEQPDLPRPETITPEPAETVPSVPADQIAAVSPVVPPLDLGPIIRETVTPIDAASAGLAVLEPTAPQTLHPLPNGQSPPQVVGAMQPNTPVPPPPSAQDLALGDLIDRIRAALSDPCLLALPRRDGAGGVGLAMIAASDTAMAQFANNALTAADSALRQTRTLVDPRQCPALTYMRQNRDYPATRLGLQLDTSEVASGGRLTGVLRGTAGRYLLLILVDNNGVVQDLQRFVSFSGNFARFDVPVTRAGDARDTSQLLLAIATQRPTNTLRERAGQLAQDVFAALEGELATGAALAIATFDVR